MKNFAAIFALLFPLTVASACSGGGDDDSPTVDAAAVAIDAALAIDSGPRVDVCYPTGIYGKCGELGCPNCLRGATIYQVCTSACTINSDCGSPADFEGASPLCAALNPGADEMICVLTCTDTNQCPCGLECRPSGVPNVDICAETL